jgi:hypothetical protein
MITKDTKMQKEKKRISTKKRISVSPKRQITLPLAFVKQLGIEQEVDCVLEQNAIKILPVYEDTGAFDDLILAELISEGYTGQELLCKFKEQRSKIRPAVEKLLEEADRAAEKLSKKAKKQDEYKSK